MISAGCQAATILLAIGISSVVAYVSHDRDIQMSAGLTVTSIGVTGTLLLDLGSLFWGENLALVAGEMITGSLIVLGWVYLIAHYTDNEWAVRDRRIVVVALPMAATAVVYLVEALYAVSGGGGGLLVQDLAAWDSGFTLYSYLLTSLTIVALVVRFRNERPIYRRRAALLALAPLPPALIAATYILGVNPLSSDLTPAGYAMTTLIALVALEKYDLLEIVPLARETTVNNIEDAVIAVTDDGTIASINDPGKEMLYVTDAVVGRDIRDGLGGWPPVVDAVRNGDEEQLRIDDTHVKVSLTPIETEGTRLGTVVQLKDVTEQVERTKELREKQRELERKNEQLDEFARVVSHDIRNPLTIAKGHLDMVADEVENERSIAMIADAHDRIESIAEDVLERARQGRQVAETTDVDFVAVARSARDTTAISEANFECAGPSIVEADPARLQQLLENLFRNAVEHGSTSHPSHASEDASEHGSEAVSVRVGPLDDEQGFYVEDDGPGIPEAERDRVFEYGYTHSDDGTGLGLNIVESIAEAHGWEVRVVEGRDGGARFEFATGETGSDGERIARDTLGRTTL